MENVSILGIEENILVTNRDININPGYAQRFWFDVYIQINNQNCGVFFTPSELLINKNINILNTFPICNSRNFFLDLIYLNMNLDQLIKQMQNPMNIFAGFGQKSIKKGESLGEFKVVKFEK